MTNKRPSLLICDDDQTFQLALRQLLKKDFEVSGVFNTDEALAVVKNRKMDILLMDVQMRSPREGIEAISRLKAIDEDLTIVMLSGTQDFELVREAMQLGAADYIPKGCDPAEIIHSLDRVFDKKRLLLRQQQQVRETTTQHRRNVLIGMSPAMVALRKLIEKIRPSSAHVVILGETGTGKEVVARLLRPELPDGCLAPFVAVDSSTIHDSTAESLLFGHEKGAFTGADKMKKGVFEEANGGILYFDEIGNMSLEIQSKLLRAIQEKEIVRLGSSRVIPLEFRLVCATNRDLEDLIKQRLFKDDLYQRLSVIPISIPPLRDRKEDIPDLVFHFIEINSTADRTMFFTEDALSALQAYSWPGNIRELGNLIAYLFAVTEGSEIDVADLPPKFRDNRSLSTPVLSKSSTNFYEQVSAFEKQFLTEEYRKAGANISQLALSLGMDRSHLYSKLRLYQIHSAAPSKPTKSALDLAPVAP